MSETSLVPVVLGNIRGFSCSKLTNLEMENMNLKEQLEKQQCKESDVLEKINVII